MGRAIETFSLMQKKHTVQATVVHYLLGKQGKSKGLSVHVCLENKVADFTYTANHAKRAPANSNFHRLHGSLRTFWTTIAISTT